jgi:hypothetical protein
MNAVGKPKFRIYSENNLIQEITLDLTNTEGLIETAIPINISHTLIDYTITKKEIGWRLKWTLHYNEWITIDNLLKIQEVLRYARQGFNINFTPRIDLPQRNYEVVFSSDNISIGIITQKGKYFLNKGVILEFTSKQILNDLNIINIDNIPFAVYSADEFAFVII